MPRSETQPRPLSQRTAVRISGNIIKNRLRSEFNKYRATCTVIPTPGACTAHRDIQHGRLACNVFYRGPEGRCRSRLPTWPRIMRRDRRIVLTGSRGVNGFRYFFFFYLLKNNGDAEKSLLPIVFETSRTQGPRYPQ